MSGVLQNEIAAFAVQQCEQLIQNSAHGLEVTFSANVVSRLDEMGAELEVSPARWYWVATSATRHSELVTTAAYCISDCYLLGQCHCKPSALSF